MKYYNATYQIEKGFSVCIIAVEDHEDEYDVLCYLEKILEIEEIEYYGLLDPIEIEEYVEGKYMKPIIASEIEKGEAHTFHSCISTQ
jgi:hypothetical protein